MWLCGGRVTVVALEGAVPAGCERMHAPAEPGAAPPQTEVLEPGIAPPGAEFVDGPTLGSGAPSLDSGRYSVEMRSLRGGVLLRVCACVCVCVFVRACVRACA